MKRFILWVNPITAMNLFFIAVAIFYIGIAKHSDPLVRALMTIGVASTSFSIAADIAAKRIRRIEDHWSTLLKNEFCVTEAALKALENHNREHEEGWWALTDAGKEHRDDHSVRSA